MILREDTGSNEEGISAVIEGGSSSPSSDRFQASNSLNILFPKSFLNKAVRTFTKTLNCLIYFTRREQSALAFHGHRTHDSEISEFPYTARRTRNTTTIMFFCDKILNA